MSQLKQLTEFRCAICDEVIQFDPNDSKTYEAKTAEDTFFGMKLTTFRVSHEIGNNRHVNTIIVDHRGLFRGKKDAFVEEIRLAPDSEIPIWVVGDEEKVLKTHPYFSVMLMLDYNEKWLMVILNESTFRMIELAHLINEKVIEALKVYKEVPEILTITVADQDFRIWLEGSRIVGVVLKSPKAFDAINIATKCILQNTHNDAIPNKKLMKLVLQALAVNPKLEERYVLKLLLDHNLFSNIDFPYKARISSITQRLETRFDIASEFLTPLLRGQNSVIELLEVGYIEQVQTVFDMLDYVERRGILGLEEV